MCNPCNSTGPRDVFIIALVRPRNKESLRRDLALLRKLAVAEYLTEKGFTNFAYDSLNKQLFRLQDRLDGFREHLEKTGSRVHVFRPMDASSHPETTHERMLRLTGTGITECPRCKQGRMERAIELPAGPTARPLVHRALDTS
jgi:hypothetical protein